MFNGARTRDFRGVASVNVIINMNDYDICVRTSRNESYVRISTAAENGLIVI